MLRASSRSARVCSAVTQARKQIRSLRHSRIIDRRDPEPAAPQFVTEAVHAFAIADHNWHHVGVGIPGIDAEALELLVEIVGVFPERRRNSGCVAPISSAFKIAATTTGGRAQE